MAIASAYGWGGNCPGVLYPPPFSITPLSIKTGYGEPVDRAQLAACVALRRDMYHRFCRRAKEEGDLPKDMAAFVEWVLSRFEDKRL